MQCNIHSCLRLEEWVLIIYMMPGGSQTSTPTLSKFNHGNVSFFHFYLGEFSFFIVSLWLNMQSISMYPTPPPWTMLVVRSHRCVSNILQAKEVNIVQGGGNLSKAIAMSVNCLFLTAST